jgi:hypothetical protein
VVESVWKSIPDKTRAHATCLTTDYARLSAAALQDHVAPEIDQWKRTQETAMVAGIMEQLTQKRAVLGIDKTLAAIQVGRARLVMVARGIRGQVKQCLKCGWADRAADPACPVCGGQRHLVALREVLSALVRKVGVPVDVVAGRPAAKLKTVGGPTRNVAAVRFALGSIFTSLTSKPAYFARHL